MATHAGMTTEEFEKIVTDWLATARHPRFKRPYTELVYQPMLELLAYLRANGFKTFIVSGGGIEFMRPWTEQVYGIPPEQVVGSTSRRSSRCATASPMLFRLPEINFIDDKAGKPVGINEHIGRRPICRVRQLRRRSRDAAMDDHGRRPPASGLIVHHTDAEREYAYDRDIALRPSSTWRWMPRREQLDGGGYEERLEAYFRVRTMTCAALDVGAFLLSRRRERHFVDFDLRQQSLHVFRAAKLCAWRKDRR